MYHIYTQVSALSMLGKVAKEKVLQVCLKQVCVFQHKYQGMITTTTKILREPYCL